MKELISNQSNLPLKVNKATVATIHFALPELMYEL